MSVLILTTREQAGCNEIMEVATEGGMDYLKGIAEETEGVTLDWLDYPHLPNSQYAISPFYPKKFYSIQEWSFPEGVTILENGRIYLTANTTLPNAAVTAITLGSSSYLSGMAQSGGGLLVQESGKYAVKGQIQWIVGGNQRSALLQVNGTTVAAFYTGESSVANDGIVGYTQVVWEGALVAGDVIKLAGFQESTIALQMTAGANATWLAAHRFG